MNALHTRQLAGPAPLIPNRQFQDLARRGAIRVFKSNQNFGDLP